MSVCIEPHSHRGYDNFYHFNFFHAARHCLARLWFFFSSENEYRTQGKYAVIDFAFSSFVDTQTDLFTLISMPSSCLNFLSVLPFFSVHWCDVCVQFVCLCTQIEALRTWSVPSITLCLILLRQSLSLTKTKLRLIAGKFLKSPCVLSAPSTHLPIVLQLQTCALHALILHSFQGFFN